MPRELFLTTKENIKIRNVNTNDMSTIIKLSKAQLFQLINSVGFLGRSLGNMMSNLKRGKKGRNLLFLWPKMSCLN